MSTTGHDVPLRWIDDAPPARRSTHVLIALALVCPAIFAGFFAVGRATVPTHTSPPTTAPNLPITYAGAPIPARLGDAPSLDATGAPHTAIHRSHRAAGPAKTTQPVSAQVVQPTVASSPTTVSAPPPTATQAPTPATPTPAHHPQPQKSGGVSFDSSG
jgi:hypothetical protein